MKNLAGRKDCDKDIERELNRSKINAIRLPQSLNSEVPTSIVGELGPFKFRRAWCYWTVEGPMPLQVAREIFEDPVGRKDVRVAGRCGCLPPEEPWIQWITPGGSIVIAAQEEKKFDEIIAMGHLPKDAKDRYVFTDHPASIGAQAFVESYHVDSEVGLRLFADVIRKHGLDKTNS